MAGQHYVETIVDVLGVLRILGQECLGGGDHHGLDQTGLPQ